MSVESLYRRGNDDVATPRWIYDGLFRGWFDPCPLRAANWDGLAGEWAGDRIFVNPPYSNPLPWVERAIREAEQGKVVVLLLKHDHSTRWFARLHEAGAHLLFCAERLSFYGKPAPFPSLLAVLGGVEK
ncbi:MAG: DNA N-6-adenine-methyltransferase [Candidatus Bathyarchaeia archaeon]